MRKTKYNWIEAIWLMLDGKFMSVDVVYRIRNNELEWYNNQSDRWVPLHDGDFRKYQFYLADNPQPEYVDCTWQEACALRAFDSSITDAVQFTDGDTQYTHTWWSGFSMYKEWVKPEYKWKMKREVYHRYFR